MRRAAAVILVASSLFAATPARADEPADGLVLAHEDALMLRDGTELRGKIVERVEGDHVDIRVDGRVRRVAWTELERAEPPTRSSSVSALKVFGLVGLVATLGGAATLIGSVAVHDDTTRRPLQIGGGVALGAGLTIVFVVGAIGFTNALSAVR